MNNQNDDEIIEQKNNKEPQSRQHINILKLMEDKETYNRENPIKQQKNSGFSFGVPPSIYECSVKGCNHTANTKMHYHCIYGCLDAFDLYDDMLAHSNDYNKHSRNCF
jgi:hypothetical protein